MSDIRKKNETRWLNRLKFIEPLMGLLVWMVLYFIRFYLFQGEAGREASFWGWGIVLALVILYSFSREGMYQSARMTRFPHQMLKLMKAHFMSLLLFIVLLYFFADRRMSRTVLLAYAVTFLPVAALIRSLVRQRLISAWRQGQDQFRVLLAGDSGLFFKDLELWRAREQAGVQIVGWVDCMGKINEAQAKAQGITLLTDSLEVAKEQLKPDVIILGYSPAQADKVVNILRENHNDVTTLQILNDIPYSILGLRAEVRGGLSILTLNQPDFPAADLLMKRLMDIVGSGLGLLVLSPLLALLAVGVKLSSSGPIFFAQERVGLDGRRFRMWKFRSMRVTAEQEASWTTANDPRKTKFGSFIRATSMDELPQLWNIFNGDMSMVGPRPEQPKYVEKFRHEIPAYMLRHKMKAGLTGWAQVNGWRGDTDLNKRIDCDLEYIRNWSLWFDLKIIFLTFFKGFIHRNAY